MLARGPTSLPHGSFGLLPQLAARHRRQHGQLIRSHDPVTGCAGLAVHPYLGAAEDIGESRAVPGTGRGEDLVDRLAVDVALATTGRVDGRTEQAEPGHCHPPIIDIERPGRRNVGSLMPCPGNLAHTARRKWRAISSSEAPPPGRARGRGASLAER